MKILLFLILFISFSLALAEEEITLGCVDCYSSMSLVDSVFRSLFPGKTPKWILFQSQEYSETQHNYLKAFPEDRVIQRIKLLPLKGGLTDEAAAELARSHKIQYVLGGMDVGSQRSPNLNHLLGFKDNAPLKSVVRIEKELSAKVSGEYAIPTHILTDVEQAINWIKKLGNSEIIIKPNVGVLGRATQYFKTNNSEELKKLLEMLLATKESFIIQPKIVGPKFFANTYTLNGKTKILSAAEYFQIEYQDKPNYFLDGFLSLFSKEAKAMQKAVNVLIPAHNLEFGMAHPEFILDQETGKLYLLEMNGRVGGAGLPAIDAEIYGTSQLHMHLLALFDPKRFEKEFKNFPRGRRKNGFMMLLSSPGSGVWNKSAFEALKSHPSYFLPGPQYQIEPESKVNETLGMDSSQGIFYFVGTKDQVKAGVNLAADLFVKGQLIDHTKMIDEKGGVNAVDCANTLKAISANRSLIVEQMNKALRKINWRKF
jgi:hypothetical protein